MAAHTCMHTPAHPSLLSSCTLSPPSPTRLCHKRHLTHILAQTASLAHPELLCLHTQPWPPSRPWHFHPRAPGCCVFVHIKTPLHVDTVTVTHLGVSTHTRIHVTHVHSHRDTRTLGLCTLGCAHTHGGPLTAMDALTQGAGSPSFALWSGACPVTPASHHGHAPRLQRWRTQ
jgi:hypothetical protein